MNANEKKVVMELLRRCQQVVNTREYQRIKVCLFDANAKVGDTSSVTTLKEAFESAAIAVAELIGRGPKPTEAAAEVRS